MASIAISKNQCVTIISDYLPVWLHSGGAWLLWYPSDTGHDDRDNLADTSGLGYTLLLDKPKWSQISKWLEMITPQGKPCYTTPSLPSLEIPVWVVQAYPWICWFGFNHHFPNILNSHGWVNSTSKRTQMTYCWFFEHIIPIKKTNLNVAFRKIIHLRMIFVQYNLHKNRWSSRAMFNNSNSLTRK